MTMKKFITIVIIVMTIAAVWARTSVTNATNEIKEVKQEYISTGETLWDIKHCIEVIDPLLLKK